MQNAIQLVGGGEDINMTKHILEGNYERTTFSANISENIRNYFKILMNLQRLGGIHAFLICHLRAINIYTSEGMDKVNMDIHFLFRK